MAEGDIPTPNFEQIGQQATASANQIRQFNTVIQESANGFNIFNQQSQLAANVLNNFNDKASKTQGFFSNSRLTEQQANAFQMLGVAVTGASKSFDLLSDNSGLSKFSSQVGYTVAQFTSGAKTIRDMVGGLAKAAGALGIPGESIRKAMAGKGLAEAGTALTSLIKNFGDSVDAAQKFQNSFFTMMSTTGQANELFELAGDKLQNLNSLLMDQSKAITNAHGATGVAIPLITKYYTELGKIPGALQQTMIAGNDASRAISTLQGTIQLAHGTGREFSDITKNMTTAWELYNVKIEDAAVFTARMTELADNFGLNVQYTEGFVNRMAESFKLLGNNSEGAARMFNQFFGELQRGGLGVKPAMEIVEQMTGAMSKMSIAQRAFLSARSGGPGGLLGAINIERDLRAGNVDKVFDSVRQSLMQQFGGRIMTQDQVKTQQDASQFQRQRMLLQSGAFGNIAGNDEQATRILEALANPGRKELQGAKDLLKQQLDRGSAIEQKSLTQLVQVNQHLEEIKMQGGFRALSLAQDALTTAGTGELSRTIESNIAQGEQQGALAAMTRDGQDRSNLYANEAFGGLFKATKELTQSFDSAKKAASEAFIGPQSLKQIEEEQKEKYKTFFNQLHQQREAVQNSGSAMSDTDRRAALQRIDAQEAALKASVANRGQTRSARVGDATAASLQAHSVTRAAPASGGTVVSGPASAAQRPGEKVDLTVNVYVGDKKHVSQQQIQLEGGVRTSVNGM